MQIFTIFCQIFFLRKTVSHFFGFYIFEHYGISKVKYEFETEFAAALYKPIRTSWEHIVKEMLELENIEKDIENLLELQSADIGGTSGKATYKEKTYEKCKESL